MFSIHTVSKTDEPFWFTLDKEMNHSEFLKKVRDKQGYVICFEDNPIGVMRYNFIWDMIPFLTHIYVKEEFQRKGFGKQALKFWEEEMKKSNYKMTMTSTQVNEDAQHFYRKLGYQERGILFLDNTPLEQPGELFFIKALTSF